MNRVRRTWVLIGLTLVSSTAAAAQEGGGAARPGARRVQPASGEAEAALNQFRVPAGFKVELFAAEPRVANISSFDIDPSGNFYVVEVFRRRGGGVLDMRNLSAAWLDDDLASRTVADRIALVKRRLSPPEVRAMQVESDRVRLVKDRDGDGRADHDSVFATGFNKLEEGTAAGVLALRDDVYFANIPTLWRLRDADGDGRADARDALHTGFGVHYEISGHDLHGLRVGPDGRVYFSVGDRGLHVATPDGRTISNPDSGAVLRCEPDGSRLELVHTGLRNPQDLAFDEHGNLFTGDNNSDGGDATRWVYVVEGGDSGWRVGYQWHDFPVSRGPWNHERLWDVSPPIPAASVVPPVANPPIPGPSGLTFTPVTGLPAEWRNKFLLVDFRGGASNSGIWALANRPKGASFELAEMNQFVRNALATDVEVGYDGGVYFSDWINGWVPEGKGRLYRVVHAEAAKDPIIRQVRELLAAGLRDKSAAELAALLSHADGRVRRAAQFELAVRDDLDTLAKVAVAGDSGRLARLHAVWGIGQIGRRPNRSDALAKVLPLAGHEDEEVRAQAAKALGEAQYPPSMTGLYDRLLDPSDRVKFFAAQSLGKFGRPEAVPALIDMLKTNAGRDVYVRHAGVVALARLGDVSALTAATMDPEPEVRLCALLALRRLRRPEVATLLHDPEPQIVLEAARAINDEPVDAATKELAALAARGRPLPTGRMGELVLMRAVNANFRLATPGAAAVLAEFATRNDAPQVLRVEALGMLADWKKVSRRDRVTGSYHPREGGDPAAAAAALRPLLPRILREAPDSVRTAAAKLVPAVGLTDETVLLDVVKGEQFSGEARAAALAALAVRTPDLLSGVIDRAMASKDPALRRQAILTAATLPDGVIRLGKVLDSDNPRDQQAAFEAVSQMGHTAAEELVVNSLDRLLAGGIPPESRLDLLAAAVAHPSARVWGKLKLYESLRAKDDPLAPFRETLAGGDAGRGRAIFIDRADVQCLRCHAVKGDGGAAGPDLSGIGKRQTREYLLESLLFPARHIAQGWETVTVRLKNGDLVAGVLKSEDERHLVLADPEQGDLRIDKSNVDARRGGQTAMPHDVARPLSKHDLRDLVEFLSGLK